MRGHQEQVIQEVKGLYKRRTFDSNSGNIPDGFLSDAINVRYVDNTVVERFGVSQLFDCASTVLRFHLYNKLAGAKYIILCDNGHVYDSADLVNPILSTTGWTDFSGITLYDRFYFCGHNGSNGDSGSKSFLYVYDGTTARKAAGLKPSSGITVAVSGSAGNIETGNRYWYVAYETDSGHITKPNATGTLFNQSTVDRKASLTNIPTGPAGTAKRHILCTKRVDPNTGRQEDYEVFFVPGGLINNNTDTTLTVNFYDADLQDSADYLFDEFEEIGAMLALAHYSGRLCGTAKSGETGVVRASKSGYPESFSEIDGFILVDPSDNGDVRGLLPQSGNLFCYKDDRTYMTMDNGAEPANWPVIQVDSGLGSCVFGTAKVLDSEGPSEDVGYIATKAGLYRFQSGFDENPLSFNVDALWDPGTEAEFRFSQVIIDSVEKFIYCVVGGGDANYLLVGEYSLGLQNIRWAQYAYGSLAFECLSVFFDTSSGKVHLLFSSTNDKIYKLGPDVTLEQSVSEGPTFTIQPIIPGLGINHFVGMRFYGKGNDLTTTLYKNDTSLGAGPNIALATGEPYRTIIFNVKTSSLRVKFSLTTSGGTGKQMRITFPIVVMHKQLGSGPV